MMDIQYLSLREILKLAGKNPDDPLFVAPVDIREGDDILLSVFDGEPLSITRDGVEIWKRPEEPPA